MKPTVMLTAPMAMSRLHRSYKAWRLLTMIKEIRLATVCDRGGFARPIGSFYRRSMHDCSGGSIVGWTGGRKAGLNFQVLRRLAGDAL